MEEKEEKSNLENLKEKTYLIEKLFAPVAEILKNKPISGILLFVAVVAALLWVNIGSAESYHHLWDTHFSIAIGSHAIDKTLHHWINDGLMAIFFFVVGLEIKRELMIGDLSTWKKASLPVAAAIGGMLFPALIYVAFNAHTEHAAGWGVPMATDIAFTLGILSLLGNKVPVSLKIFLTALAIVDDLGAVLVIAFFYTENLFFNYLEYGFVFFAILAVGNSVGIRNHWFYTIFGICGLWVAFLLSGVHATIAGVLLAMTIPVKAKINEYSLIYQLNKLVNKLKNAPSKRDFFVSHKQQEIIAEIKETRRKGESPLQKMEHGLNPFVSFFVLPLFAFSNAGIVFSPEMGAEMFSRVSLGIMLGLIIGKTLGILSFSFLFVRLKISRLPAGINWKVLTGASVMAGIGFTMSIFISELAFTSEEIKTQSKMAILIASTLAAIIGMWIIASSTKHKEIL